MHSYEPGVGIFALGTLSSSAGTVPEASLEQALCELSPLAWEPAYTTSRSESRIRQRAVGEGVVSSGGIRERRLDPRLENRR